MDILMSEFEKQYFLVNEYGKFHPKYTFKNIEEIKDERGEIVDYKYIGLEITKTAQKDFEEYMVGRNPQPSKQEMLEKENNMLWDALTHIYKELGFIPNNEAIVLPVNVDNK